MKRILSLFLLGLTSVAMADVVGFINHATLFLTSPVLLLLIPALGGVIEIVLRMIPSSNPLGLAMFVARAVHALAGFFDALDLALNKVIPQNLIKSEPVATLVPETKPEEKK